MGVDLDGFALRLRSAGKVVSVPVLDVIGVFPDGHKHEGRLHPTETPRPWRREDRSASVQVGAQLKPQEIRYGIELGDYGSWNPWRPGSCRASRSQAAT